MLEAFIFDIGNVLLRFDFGVAIRRVAAECAIQPTDIFDRVVPIKDLYESGRMERGEFFRQVTTQLGFTGTEEELMAAWSDIFSANEPMHRLVETLAPGFPLYLLSNTSDLHLEWILENYPIFRHFRDGVYSHIARCMKPSPKIYDVAMKQFGIRPDRTLFIDDLAPNVEAARAAGFHAFHYDPAQHELLLVELREKFGLAV